MVDYKHKELSRKRVPVLLLLDEIHTLLHCLRKGLEDNGGTFITSEASEQNMPTAKALPDFDNEGDFRSDATGFF